MSSIQRTNTFEDDGKDLVPTMVENEFKSLFTTWNNHDSGLLAWTKLNVAGTTKFNGATYTWPGLLPASNAVLQSTSGGTLSWQLFAGLKVIQWVSATTTTEVSSTSGTYADTTLTASITPTSASNKVLVLVGQQVKATIGAAQTIAIGGYKLIRASTTIFSSDRAWGFTEGAATFTGSQFGFLSIACIDSPATTSATAYKTQFASAASGDGTVYVQAAGSTDNPSYIVLAEVVA